jgi:hypothetical protein
MPVTMPGSAIGRITRKLMLDRPKKWYRWTANAAIVPRTRAIAVAPIAARIEVPSALRAPSLFAAARHHCSVPPVGGNANVRDLLTVLSSTSSSGT